MTDQGPHPDNRLLSRLEALAQAFRPSGPVDTQDLFSGRIDQLATVQDICAEKGRHSVIFGERGVGKTSLAAFSADLQRRRGIISLRINCDTEDTFGRIWEKVIDDLILVTKLPNTRDRADIRAAVEDAIEVLHFEDPITPDRVRLGLTLLTQATRAVFFFDEFDRVRDPDAPRQFADCIKTLSDQLVDATIIIVGVADDVDSLISEHRSIERALAQVKMPRMTRDEIRAIIDNGLEAVGLEIEESAAKILTALPQGLPHYAHLLGQEAARSAIFDDKDVIDHEDLGEAIEKSIAKADQSIARLYHTATVSPRRTIFEEVILACALADKDDFGYFAPADVRQPLSKVMGETFEIPRFANHLAQLCDADRGPALERRGGERRWRYRFANPMMGPFVLIRGWNSGLLDPIYDGS